MKEVTIPGRGPAGLRLAACLTVTLLALLATPWCRAAEAPVLSDQDLALARAAFDDVERGRWEEAESVADGAGDKLPLRIIQWLDYQQAETGHSFDTIAQFVDQNPDWPLLNVLITRAESQLADESPETLSAWFARHPPITAAGKLRQAELALDAGRTAQSEAAIRDVYIHGDFNGGEAERILARYADLLTPEDHVQRLDRLLWEHKMAAARAMLPTVPKEWRQLAEARMKLAVFAKGAEAQAAKLPAGMADDPGLNYERVRLLRHEGRDDAAADLVERQTRLGRPDLWWTEQSALARRLLAIGQADRAYRIVVANQLQSPAALTDAEFIAGWIALRFLKNPAEAAPHFERLYGLAKLPLTLARGAYWAGRAASGQGHAADATRWYETAANYPTAYYGQLASAMPSVVPPPKPVPEPVASPAIRAAFDQKILVRAVRVLLAVGRDDKIKPFLNRLAEIAQAPTDFAATADFAEEIGRPDLGVAVAKKASYSGISLLRAGYPVVWMPRNAGTEQALLLALTRQESAFDLRAVSPSGARGLMQLMPGTAADTARSIGAPYSLAQLTSDGVYNVTLGQAYFDGLLATFNGSYVLAIAGYNAGPGRVQQWVNEFGDPREPAVDPVDWVESIPYEETRNYVQRVLENLQIYRLRIGDRSLAFSLDADLRR